MRWGTGVQVEVDFVIKEYSLVIKLKSENILNILENHENQHKTDIYFSRNKL